MNPAHTTTTFFLLVTLMASCGPGTVEGEEPANPEDVGHHVVDDAGAEASGSVPGLEPGKVYDVADPGIQHPWLVAAGETVGDEQEAVDRCHAHHDSETHHVHGVLSVEISVDADGYVDVVEVVEDGTGHEEFVHCVTLAMQSMVFEPPGGEGVVLATSWDLVSEPYLENQEKIAEKQAESWSKQLESRVSITSGKETGGSGIIDESQVRKAIIKRLSVLGHCHEKALKKNPGLEGKITFEFTIGEDGRISSVEAVQTAAGLEDVADCAVKKLGGFKFPYPEGGPVTFSVTMLFETEW